MLQRNNKAQMHVADNLKGQFYLSISKLWHWKFLPLVKSNQVSFIDISAIYSTPWDKTTILQDQGTYVLYIHTKNTELQQSAFMQHRAQHKTNKTTQGLHLHAA